MDRSLVEKLVNSNQPFTIETASGRRFDVPHRDFISFTKSKTAVIISFEENGGDSFAIVPLLTVTSITAREPIA